MTPPSPPLPDDDSRRPAGFASTSLGLLDQARDLQDGGAWARLLDLYTPYLRGWLRRYGVSAEDAEDLTQEVFRVVASDLPRFQHNHRPGAFRCWLRTILVHRLRDFRRAERTRGRVRADTVLLDQMAVGLDDDGGELIAAWERDHDAHVVRGLLELIRPEFTTTTWRAFERLVLGDERPDQVAADLGLTLEATYAAKSRVMRRLREVGAGFLD